MKGKAWAFWVRVDMDFMLFKGDKPCLLLPIYRDTHRKSLQKNRGFERAGSKKSGKTQHVDSAFEVNI